MEARDHQIAHTEAKVSTDLQNKSGVLDLSDDCWTAHTKTEDELTSDNEDFSHLLMKMRIFVDRSNGEKFEISDFIRQWQIIDDFLNLIEKHEKYLTDEHSLILEKRLTSFIHATNSVDPDDVLTSNLNESKKIFYMYFNLFNNRIVQKYLNHVETSATIKILCRLCIYKMFEVMIYTCRLSDLGLHDLERPINCIELLSLMLNYVQQDFPSLDLTADPSLPTDPSITTFNILSFMIWYGDKTILTQDLMEIGCSQIMLDILAIICR